MRDRELPSEASAREAWRRRSHLVLEHYLPEHERVLEAFGLERAVPEREATRFLRDYLAKRRTKGLMKEMGPVRLPLPDGREPVVPGLPEIRLLVATAEGIAAELDCEPHRVVAFLLTGKVFDLPWIEIETRQGELGPSFVIHVGTSDIEGALVRAAYVAAVRRALGTESTRALPAHVYPLVTLEVEGRLAGLTWQERWEAWKRYAAQWSFTAYDSIESYRNYANKKAAQNRWIREELETADAAREYEVNAPQTEDVQRSFRAAKESE